MGLSVEVKSIFAFVVSFVKTRLGVRFRCRLSDYLHNHDMGHGGALVESIAFNRRVVGSTPALAVT